MTVMVTKNQIQVMRQIEEGPRRVGNIALSLRSDYDKVRSVLKRLERKGLVEKDIQRYPFVWRLTPKGKEEITI